MEWWIDNGRYAAIVNNYIVHVTSKINNHVLVNRHSDKIRDISNFGIIHGGHSQKGVILLLMPHRSSRAVARKNQRLVGQRENLGLNALNQGIKIAARKIRATNTFVEKHIA